MNRRRCLFCLAASSLLSMAQAAWAHSASSLSGLMYDWEYDGLCCGGDDCVPVPASAIIEEPEGIRVKLAPGQHPKAPNGLEELVPYDVYFGTSLDPQRVIRNAPQGVDGHICIYGSTQSDGVFRRVRCIYRGQREG